MAFQFNSDTQERIPDMPPPQERIGRFSVGVLLAFAVLIVIWTAWNPLVAAAKTSWGRHCAREAQIAISGKDWSLAVAHLQAARRWAPDDIVVIRAFVEFYHATGSDPATLAQELRQLAGHTALTAEEQRLLGQAYVTTGKTADARAVFDVLPDKESPEAMDLLSHILAAEGHAGAAAEISHRSLRQQTDTPETRFQLAIEDRQHRFPEVRYHARLQLWSLAKLDQEIALDAALQLAADPDLTLAEARQLLQIVEAHPHQQLQHRLPVISAIMRLQPERREAVLAEEIERFGSQDDGSLPVFARWLALEKQHARLIKLLPRDLVLKSRDLYPIVADALVAEARWQELNDMLTSSRPPVSLEMAAVWRAEVQSHLQPDLKETRLLLQGSIDGAKRQGNVAALFAAAVLAEKLNLNDLALAACQAAAINDSDSSIKFLQKAGELARLQKNSTALLVVSRQLHDLRPSSDAFADRLLYLRLILGVEMETVVLSAVKQPAVPNSATAVVMTRIPDALLRALAAYRLGDVEGARASLADLPDISRLSPGERAVAAGLLSLTGKAAQAFQIAERIPDAALLDEERAFLNRAK